MENNKKRVIAENRKDGSTAPKPKDASTLILHRNNGSRIEILMGERSPRHSFMPNTYVFPGGRVDAGDARVIPAKDLRGDVMERLCRGGCSPARARALATAAIRETFEETGLQISASYDRPRKSKVNIWNEFGTVTCGPDLSRLEYIARAVTPPMRKKRFNTRFFIMDGNELEGELLGSDELLDMKWVTLSEARDLEIPAITEYILGEAEGYLKSKPKPNNLYPVKLFKMVNGKRVYTTE